MDYHLLPPVPGKGEHFPLVVGILSTLPIAKEINDEKGNPHYGIGEIRIGMTILSGVQIDLHSVRNILNTSPLLTT